MFIKYDEEIIFKILKARVKSAFSNHVSDKELRLITEYSEKKGGNVKIAFNLLLNADEIANEKNQIRLKNLMRKRPVQDLKELSLMINCEKWRERGKMN